MTTKTRYFTRLFLGVSLSAAYGIPALSQDRNAADEGGARSTFTTTVGATGGRNLDLSPGGKETETRLNGVLGYSYQKTTRRTKLQFDASINPEDAQDGVYPDVGLRIEHTGARYKFDASASYAEAKVTDQNLGFNADTGGIVEYDGTGTRTLRQFSVGFEGGVDMPLGYTLDIDHSRVGYRGDTLGDDYSPSKNTRVGAGIRADVSSMTRLNFDISRQDYRSENLLRTHRTTDIATFGIDQRIDAVNDLGVFVGRQSVDTARTSGTETRRGTVFGAEFSHTYSLGVSGVDYHRDLTENGMRDELLLRHSRTTALGRFNGSIGASKAKGGDTNWIGAVTYDTTLLRNKMSVAFTRNVMTNDDGDDVVVSRLSADLSHDFSDINGLDFGLMASSTKETDDDSTRVDATVTYRHTLTQDISVQAGVRFNLSKKSEREDAESQSLFVNVTRQVTFLH